MSHPDDQFSRLARLARRAPEEAPPAELPVALATRVLAQLSGDDRPAISAWEWLSLRALPVAAALTAGFVFLGDDTWPVRPDDEQRIAQAMVQDQLAP